MIVSLITFLQKYCQKQKKEKYNCWKKKKKLETLVNARDCYIVDVSKAGNKHSNNQERNKTSTYPKSKSLEFESKKTKPSQGKRRKK